MGVCGRVFVGVCVWGGVEVCVNVSVYVRLSDRWGGIWSVCRYGTYAFV